MQIVAKYQAGRGVDLYLREVLPQHQRQFCPGIKSR
jgi:hypothetical protein